MATLKVNGKSADLFIMGDIVTESFWDGETSGNDVAELLKNVEVEEINVHIDSYGGSVSEGWAIYNTLKQHPAKVNTYGDGFVASAALFPFLAGDNRYASTLSAYFLHEVMSGAAGYADDLRKAADEIDVMTSVGVGAFTENTKLTEEEVRELMKEETWLTPVEALSFGIATAMVEPKTDSMAQSAKKQIMQKLFKESAKPVEAVHAPEIPEEEKPKEEKTEQSLMKMLCSIF